MLKAYSSWQKISRDDGHVLWKKPSGTASVISGTGAAETKFVAPTGDGQ